MALVAGLIANDEKISFFSKKNIPNSKLQCKNHTQFEPKMTKIDTLPLTKMS